MTPTAYYNEIDPFAAAWLRELIKAGHIAPGEVDERSIEDVKPTDLRGFQQCHFFAGIGVWSYALRQAGWPDDRPVWTGSCPCQPFSTAGKRTGTADERHLWPALFHLVTQLKPDYLFGEQVASKDGLKWFDAVQSDLEAQEYSIAAVDLCAAGFGAPHIRQRLYFVADAKNSIGRRAAHQVNERRWSTQIGGPGATNGYWSDVEWLQGLDSKFRPTKPGVYPLAHGSPNRVGRLRGYGNAIVAPVATAFIEAFLETETERGSQ